MVERVVAVHDRLRAELPEVLHEVVDERVVVVDHEHARTPRDATGRARRRVGRTGFAR